MGILNKEFWVQSAVQAAFIAISSRVVGSVFRCLETLNPQYQQSKVISDPKTVCIRELSTISMSWCFALGINMLIKPFAKRQGWGDFRVQFLTSLIGTTIAESLGRMIAYRKALSNKALPLPLSQGGNSIPFPVNNSGRGAVSAPVQPWSIVSGGLRV